MRTLLILRPEPGASRTADHARQAGLEPIVAPLFQVAPVPWQAPDAAKYDALLLTSANAALQGGTELHRLHILPVFAVGEATAAAAWEQGFQDVHVGTSDGAEVLTMAIRRGCRSFLHLAGREYRGLENPAAHIDRIVVYASEALDALPALAIDALRNGAVALLHSPRAASLFGALVDAARLPRALIPIAGFSPAVIAAAGADWASAVAADQPTDKSLLEIAARLCEQDIRRR